jgi:hypothetical protein
MCFYISPTNVSEIFLILRKTQQDIIINVHSSYVKYTLLFSDLKRILNSSRDFRKILELQISLKSSLWNQLFHADGQTDTTKLIATFGTFLNAPKKGCTFMYHTLQRLKLFMALIFRLSVLI